MKYFWLCSILLFVALQSLSFAAPASGAGSKMDSKFMKFLRQAKKEKPAGGNPVDVVVTPEKGEQRGVEHYIGNLRDQGYAISYDTDGSGNLAINGDPTPVLKLLNCKAVKYIAEKAGF